MMGDNEALFTSAETLNSELSGSALTLQTVKRMKKYLNITNYCQRADQQRCKKLYYLFEEADSDETWDLSYTSFVALNDGTVLYVQQQPNCDQTEYATVTNADGTTTKEPWHRYFCASVYVDVNGEKKPNKFGKDAYRFDIYNDRIEINSNSRMGGQKAKDNLFKF